MNPSGTLPYSAILFPENIKNHYTRVKAKLCLKSARNDPKLPEIAGNDRIEIFAKSLIQKRFAERIRETVILKINLGKVAFYRWRFCLLRQELRPHFLYAAPIRRFVKFNLINLLFSNCAKSLPGILGNITRLRVKLNISRLLHIVSSDFLL